MQPGLVQVKAKVKTAYKTIKVTITIILSDDNFETLQESVFSNNQILTLS